MNTETDKSKYITLAIIVLVLVVAGYFAYKAISKNKTDQVENSPAGSALVSTDGESKYTDINGNALFLDDYLGRVLVVNSWASWSPQSAQELVSFATVVEQYSDTDVVLLAINRAEPKETAQAFLNSISVADSVVLVLDPTDNYYEAIEGFAMPETLFYDTSGNVVAHKRGSITENEMKEHIQSAINASE